MLLPQTATAFRELCLQRNHALHFNLNVEENDRELALSAIQKLQEIVHYQFASYSDLPWLLPMSGELYIKRDYENSPFAKLIYIPNSIYLGYKNEVVSIFPWEFEDANDYLDHEVDDDEFKRLRDEYRLYSKE